MCLALVPVWLASVGWIHVSIGTRNNKLMLLCLEFHCSLKLFVKQENVNLYDNLFMLLLKICIFKKLHFTPRKYLSLYYFRAILTKNWWIFHPLIPLMSFHKKKMRKNAVNIRFRAKSLKSATIYLTDFL